MTIEKKSFTLKSGLENLLAIHNVSLSQNDTSTPEKSRESMIAREKGKEALASANEKIKELNDQLEKEFVEGFVGMEDPIYEALKVGYYTTYRIKQDRDTQKVELTERDTIVALPSLFEAINQKASMKAWKDRVENFTFRMAGRANREVGAMDAKKFAALYKASDEAKKSGEKDPLSNASLRSALQAIVDEVCNHPDEKGMNAFKFDERYVKYLLLTVFKTGKGKGCSIAIPNANTMAKFITICLYSLINGLDFKIECKQLEADQPKREERKAETK